MFQTSGNKLYSNCFDHFLPEETQNLASQRKDRLCRTGLLLTRAHPCSFQKGLPLGKVRNPSLHLKVRGQKIPGLLESIIAAHPAARTL